ncbi:large subunit ribosomal protein L18 [Metamycoplasma subdolum]|uniref:Large ribosomal subunit protein uL18 n=1 Tax=Metamycoplasma subdolum TaxID=92407 RepID=A0A3M0A1C5_9BACT|nr:50S ribosomal protein L18 [Metamycoplasma subdolum]RMA78590.1 large subunit ribosomal protein L18 [Metamycoplasma subdolum]WPB50273.1 50S ribosomal protein L18 [Metamycoplasma subdolum]
MILSRNDKRKAKHLKITNKLAKGSKSCPRVVVYKSLHHFYTQAIDDLNHLTITSSSTQKLALKTKNNDSVKLVAQDFAKSLKKSKINKIVFDRSGYIYHGKIKTFCDTLREEGIKF